MDVHGLAGYLGGDIHAVAEEREARQGEIVLEGFVEVEAEVGEDHPKLLPAVGVLELAEEVAGELVLQGPLVVHDGHAGGEVQRGGGGGERRRGRGKEEEGKEGWRERKGGKRQVLLPGFVKGSSTGNWNLPLRLGYNSG